MNHVFNKWKRRWQRAIRNHAATRELAAITPAERMRSADDVGFGGTDLRCFRCTHMARPN
jgi:hypothetical protein